MVKLGCNNIHYGENATSALEELPSEKKRAMIVMTGTVMEDLGLLKPVTDALEKGGFKWEKYTDIEEDATFASISRGIAAIKAFEPDWIIAFGGGSAIDAAKTLWVMYENPEVSKLKEIALPNFFKKIRERARLCCIPTSAGTGSECTIAAMVKDTEKLRKVVVVGTKKRLIPDVAILDPLYSASMPKGLTAGSGMDVITHIVEAYVSVSANPFSDGLAISAFIQARSALPIAYENGKDLAAREKMLLASCMAGISFANCGLGINHSIAHSFGAEFGVPHGLANAIILPHTIKFNETDAKVSARYRELASFVGENSLLGVIEDLNARLGIPKTMREFIKDDAAFEKKFEDVSKKSTEDVNNYSSPVKPTPEQMKALVKEVYYGK
jgi:alcohol dehydrogenase class IV